jgi:hypothetical protein
VAQSQIIYGLGQPDFTTLAGQFIYVEPMAFEITGESQEKTSKKFVNGRLVTAGSLIDDESYKMKVSIQAASWTALQFAHGEMAGTTSSISLPEVRYAKVPSASPYEIVDADVGTSAGVWVFQVDPIDKPLVLSVGAPAAGAFQVDATNTKLVFNAAQAGASIAYRVFKTYSNVGSIGEESLSAANVLSQFSFSGLAYSDTKPYRIVIPKMARVSVPSISLSDVTTLEAEFRLVVANGKRSAYQLFDI